MKRDDKEVILETLKSRPIAYRVDLAHIGGGVLAGVFLSQLFYWSDKGQRGDGFIYKTQEEWEAETGLTRANQVTARKQLRERNLIAEHKHSVPARLHYRINVDVVLEALARPTRIPKSGAQARRDAEGKFAVTRRTIPEITPETTTERGHEDVTTPSGKEQEGETKTVSLPTTQANVSEANGIAPAGVQASPSEKEDISRADDLVGDAALDEVFGPRVPHPPIERKGKAGNWASPVQAGGADTPAQVFVDKISSHYGLGGYDAMPAKKARQWATRVSEAFVDWGGATEAQARVVADAFVEAFGWRETFNPYERTFADNVGPLLMQVRNGSITQDNPAGPAAKASKGDSSVVRRNLGNPGIAERHAATARRWEAEDAMLAALPPEERAAWHAERKRADAATAASYHARVEANEERRVEARARKAEEKAQKEAARIERLEERKAMLFAQAEAIEAARAAAK
jgi:hypothetical protein